MWTLSSDTPVLALQPILGFTYYYNILEKNDEEQVLLA